MNNTELGNKIKKLRKENKISQAALAKRFGLSQGAISQWERGVAKPDIVRLKAMADMFKVPVAELLDDNENPSMTVKTQTVGSNIRTPKKEKDTLSGFVKITIQESEMLKNFARLKSDQKTEVVNFIEYQLEKQKKNKPDT